MKESTITVTGLGCIKVTPDVTRIELNLVSLHDDYNEAYEQAKINTEMLAKIMDEASLDTQLPKTVNLDIEKKTESIYKHGNYNGEKFLGFELTHKVKIDLGMDNRILTKVLHLIGQYLRQAEINILHTVNDPRPCQKRMLEQAVKDAKEKATIMATACGCRLGNILDIDYSFQEMHIYSTSHRVSEPAYLGTCADRSLDINPDDIDCTDNVKVVWQLLNLPSGR